MAINFLIPIAASLEIDLEFPDEVEIDEEFTVEISADSDEEYDVKIFVHESDSDEIDRDDYVSEIYDEGDESWEDSWYYLKNTFPDQEEYELRIFDGEGDLEICVRLRESSDRDAGFEQECDLIEVFEAETDEDENKRGSEESRDGPRIWRNTQEEEPRETELETEALSQPQEKIILNKNPPKKEQEKEKIITPEGNKRNILIYSFTGFCILVIVLLALRKL